MRKFSAILLLIIFLFNLVGYRFFYNYEQQKADVQLEASLDNNQYNDADLITISVPLSMPYQTAQSNWERVNGEVTYNGKIYKYVKRRIVDGEMMLMCVRDANKMRIQNAKSDYFKNANDIASSTKKSDNSKSNTFKNWVSEYDHQLAAYSLSQFIISSKRITLTQKENLLFSPHHPLMQPPDVM